MKIEKTTLKLFLTSGVTLTVGSDEEVMNMKNESLDLFSLSNLIDEVLKEKSKLEFVAVIKHKYKNEKGKEDEQEIKHYYNIPSDRISWYMIEEV